MEMLDKCPDCGSQFGAANVRTRSVMEIEPVKVKRICYELERRSCSRCRKSFQSQAPSVLPKEQSGNQLLRSV
ncbi:MAG: IS66 family transposase zinc-finger binding domain-containing protein [Acidobacteria bacterium]|nr:IS66 family transposase zinc-finger binding domain-containing protein [Acidobacteriota bacterium]MCW5967549.1 IS66 family transposase zinc-finger binding domain-containing protein [Blastocatellales bacterium]